MGRRNHHAIDNGDVDIHPLEYPFESTYKYVPCPGTTPIKTIDDDEMDHLLEFFHSDYDDDLLDVNLQVLQD